MGRSAYDSREVWQVASGPLALLHSKSALRVFGAPRSVVWQGKRFPFLLSRRGTRLDGGHVRRTFYHLSRRVGLREVSSTHSSRLHDYRHYVESWNMPHRVFAKLSQAFKTAADPIRNAVPMRHSPICFQPSKKMRFPPRMERFSLLLY